MHIIIPARYASTRLPGKPLQDIHGKSLIQRVYECTVMSGAISTVIATDDARIRDAAKAFGAQVCMTSPAHRSGTERIAEVVDKLAFADDEIIINLQGDEPLMPASLIKHVADTLVRQPEAAAATAMYPITDQAQLNDPNVVKVVCDRNGLALLFSRAPIPWARETHVSTAGESPLGAFRHIGIYAYRAGFVSSYSSWPPCPLEQIEMLEQLRMLWYGARIAVCEALETPGPGVDTPEDLETVRRIFETRSK